MSYSILVAEPSVEELAENLEPELAPEVISQECEVLDQFTENLAEAVTVRNKRHKGPNLKSRLLCLECAEIVKVAAVEGASITLVCGHSRPGILPTDRVSIEHMSSAIGRKLFPVPRYDDAVSRPAFEEFRKCQ